jgi:ATP-dependent RNA helicase HelY
MRDLTGAPHRITHIDVPRPLAPRSPQFRRQVAEAMRGIEAVPPADAEAHVERDRAYEGHPVHGCPDRDRHLAFLQRSEDVRREVVRMEERVHRRSGALTRVFERVLEVLERLDYVRDWTLTRRGETLAVLYSEVDLLVTESLAEGVFDGLDAPEVAALVSCLTFEPRMEDPGVALPSGARLREALLRVRAIWRDLVAVEEDLGVPLTREPHEGFADYAYRWARGEPLHEVLGDDELPGGDFVREAKQVIDLLRQLAQVDEAMPFGDAADRLERGVVAYSSL